MIEIVRSDLNSNSIAGHDANLITTHLSSESALNRVIHIVDLHEKRPAHFFCHRTFEFNRFFFWFLWLLWQILLPYVESKRRKG